MNENKTTNKGRFATLLGFIAGFLIVAIGAAMLLGINPLKAVQDFIGFDDANSQKTIDKVTWDEATQTITTGSGKFEITSYDTAIATVDLSDPNQNGHRLLILRYTFTNTSDSKQRPFTVWSDHVTAFQGKTKLTRGMQLVGTNGPDVDNENTTMFDQPAGSTIEGVTHFDFNPYNPEPVKVVIKDGNGKTIHTIKYNLSE